MKTRLHAGPYKLVQPVAPLRPGETLLFRLPAPTPPRALDVLDGFLRGESTAETARGLNLKSQTVKNRISWWCREYGVSGPNASVDLVLLFGLRIPEASVADNVGADAAWARLALREQKIVRLLLLSLTSEVIAVMTGINAHSMRRLLSEHEGIYDKLGVSTRPELAIWYISHRFVDWHWNDPCPCPFPGSDQCGVLVASPDRKRRTPPPPDIHDREAILRGTSTGPCWVEFGVITEPAELCREMGISAELFPNGLLARSRKPVRRKQGRTLPRRRS
jgi:DNA-binding CsgD family transcriptional regulator